ncbi:hypothetical protein [Sinomicrobium sp. M5D2P9]
MCPKYKIEKDDTLTRSQSKNKQFKSNRGFRNPSNKTLAGHRSGYHESAVTTDTYTYLTQATNNNDGTHTLANATKNKIFKKYVNTKVNSKILNHVINIADGYRTDTAQTILSRSNNRIAGHSGSGMPLSGQAEAHDLLRKSVMDILTDGDLAKSTSSEEVIAIIFGSMTVTSIAPGKLAQTLISKKHTLKDTTAGPIWEANRNEMKKRVSKMYAKLDDDSKQIVLKYAKDFISSTQDTTLNQPDRYLEVDEPHSPMRDEDLLPGVKISGGSYAKGKRKLNTNTLSPPDNTTHAGEYITAPKRAKRRKLK